MLKVALAAESAHAFDPARVLAALNQSLYGKFQEHFATAAYVFVDMEKKLLSYAGAGHPPLLMWRMSTGSASEVLKNGLPLCLFSGGTYSAVEVPVEPGDKAVLYSDGILETRSPSQQEGSISAKDFLNPTIVSQQRYLPIRSFVSCRPDQSSRRDAGKRTT